MNKKHLVLPVAVFAALFPATAHATKVVTSPYVKQGVAAVEFRGGYETDDDNDDSWKTKLQGSYGVTNFWDVKLSGTFEGADHEESEFTDVTIENKFQLTEKGKYFVDVGARLDYTYSTTGDADEIAGKIILAKPVGPVNNIMNFEMGREVGEDSEDDFFYEIDYAGSVEIAEDLRLGAEWYSAFGTFEDDSDEWDEQEHQVGPVLYGTSFGNLKWQVGALAGISEAAPDAMIKTILRYEF